MYMCILKIYVYIVHVHVHVMSPPPGAPPHVPLVSSSDDMSNFDTFEPLKENNLRYPNLPSKNQKTFSGKSLPFVGFTFTRFDTSFDQW